MMIIRYSFGNVFSFREERKLSMVAPNSKVKNRFPDNYVKLPCDYDVNKVAVIVGENAGGKSNFVSGLRYLQTFFLRNERVRAFKSTVNTNNIVGNCPKEMETKQRFYIEVSDAECGIFSYELIVDFSGIISEKLWTQNKRTSVKKEVFEVNRILNEMDCLNIDECLNGNLDKKGKCEIGGTVGYEITIFDKSLSGIEEALEKKSSGEDDIVGLFVTKLALFGVKEAVRFTHIIIDDICPEVSSINYDLIKSFKKEQDDLNILNDKRYFEIFRLVDYSIVDVSINAEDPFKKSIIYRKRKDGSIFSREISSDSNGVKEFFAWAIQIFKVLYEDKIVIADEMDKILNPVLSDRIVSLINGREHKGQFIFTTHNVLHLDLSTYMKEQIYFITKDSETLESDMYSLSEFPEVRYEVTKVYEFYLKGVLGGTASE